MKKLGMLAGLALLVSTGCGPDPQWKKDQEGYIHPTQTYATPEPVQPTPEVEAEPLTFKVKRGKTYNIRDGGHLYASITYLGKTDKGFDLLFRQGHYRGEGQFGHGASMHFRDYEETIEVGRCEFSVLEKEAGYIVLQTIRCR